MSTEYHRLKAENEELLNKQPKTAIESENLKAIASENLILKQNLKQIQVGFAFENMIILNSIFETLRMVEISLCWLFKFIFYLLYLLNILAFYMISETDRDPKNFYRLENLGLITSCCLFGLCGSGAGKLFVRQFDVGLNADQVFSQIKIVDFVSGIPLPNTRTKDTEQKRIENNIRNYWLLCFNILLVIKNRTKFRTMKTLM